MISTSIPRSIDAADLKGRSGEVLQQVGHDQTSVVIAERGVPVAVVIPIADFERLQRYDARREAQRQALKAFGDAFRDLSDDDIERAVAQALAEEHAKDRGNGAVAETK